MYVTIYTQKMLKKKICFENYPIASMYGTVPCTYHNQPNVGKYTSPMDAMGTNLPRRIVQEFFVEIEWPWHLRVEQYTNVLHLHLRKKLTVGTRKMSSWKRNNIYGPPIFGFHVNFGVVVTYIIKLITRRH